LPSLSCPVRMATSSMMCLTMSGDASFTSIVVRTVKRFSGLMKPVLSMSNEVKVL